MELISDRNKVLLRKKIMEEKSIFRNFFLGGRYSRRGGIGFVLTPILCAMQMNPFYTRQFAVYKDTESLLMLKVRYEKEKENRYLMLLCYVVMENHTPRKA